LYLASSLQLQRASLTCRSAQQQVNHRGTVTPLLCHVCWRATQAQATCFEFVLASRFLESGVYVASTALSTCLSLHHKPDPSNPRPVPRMKQQLASGPSLKPPKYVVSRSQRTQLLYHCCMAHLPLSALFCLLTCRTLGVVVRQARDAFRLACTCLNRFNTTLVLALATPCDLHQLQTQSKPDTPACHTIPHKASRAHNCDRMHLLEWPTHELSCDINQYLAVLYTKLAAAVIPSIATHRPHNECSPAMMHTVHGMWLQLQALPARFSRCSSTL
jgi:hypothetical protein